MWMGYRKPVPNDRKSHYSCFCKSILFIAGTPVDDQSVDPGVCRRIEYSQAGEFILKMTAQNDISAACLEYVVRAQYPAVATDFNIESNGPSEAFQRK